MYIVTNSVILRAQKKLVRAPKSINNVLNLSQRKLSPEELSALELGFSMSWPSKLDELQIKTETEFSYKSLIDSVELKSEEKDRIRSKMKGSAMTYIKHKKEV